MAEPVANIPTPGPSMLMRVWNACRSFLEALDYGPYDYLCDRMSQIERELNELQGDKPSGPMP
jgi:hypothetical protein